MRTACCGHAVKLSGIALAVLFLPGCFAVAPDPGPLRGNLVIDVERDRNVPPGEVLLKPVPGGLSGRSRNSPVNGARSDERGLHLAVEEISSALSRHAAPARSDEYNPGELVEPRDLRMARVGTFFEPDVRVADCNNFRTGLATRSRGSNMLVYVDRAGAIRGSRYARPWIMRYELEFPEAGLYLVDVSTQGLVVTQRVVRDLDGVSARVRRAGCG